MSREKTLSSVLINYLPNDVIKRIITPYITHKSRYLLAKCTHVINDIRGTYADTMVNSATGIEELFISSYFENKIQVFNSVDISLSHVYDNIICPTGIAVIPHLNQMFIGNDRSFIDIVDITTGKLVRRIKMNDENIKGISRHSNHSMLNVCNYNHLYYFDEKGNKIGGISFPHTQRIYSAKNSELTNNLLIAGNDFFAEYSPQGTKIINLDKSEKGREFYDVLINTFYNNDFDTEQYVVSKSTSHRVKLYNLNQDRTINSMKTLGKGKGGSKDIGNFYMPQGLAKIQSLDVIAICETFRIQFMY